MSEEAARGPKNRVPLGKHGPHLKTWAELSPATVASLVAGATRHLDVLAYVGLWLWDAVPGFAQALVAKIDAGCSVRLCLGDPDSPAVRLRGEDKGIGDGLAVRCRLALTYARPVIERGPGTVRCSGRTLYTSLLRVDNEVLVNTHFWGEPGECLAGAPPATPGRRRRCCQRPVLFRAGVG